MAKLIFSWIALLHLCICFFGTSNAAYNVVSLGARPDGQTDSTQAFLNAWSSACRSVQPVSIYVPPGRFLVGEAVFRGPCRSRIDIQIAGTLVAPLDYRAMGNSGFWLLFNQVNRVKIIGGTVDARGSGFWACRSSRGNCPAGARSIAFNWASRVVISGLTSINSQSMHIVINNCNNVLVRNVKIIAPDQSPNTDGIHVEGSTSVTITGSIIKTGDDCISIGPGTKNLWMDQIHCGPGHGISIGSLSKDFNEAGVENITLTNSFFTGSQNGLRIKSWARPSNGFVRNVVYSNINMRNVLNPIIIDQNYCPTNQGCPHQSSSVKISDVTYKNIQGTSATPIAVKFDCSFSNPCSGIILQDIKLTYLNRAAQSSCNNIDGIASGLLIPNSCL